MIKKTLLQPRRTIILLSVALLLGVFLIGNVSAFNWRDGTVAYYSLDESTGTNFKNNATPYNNNGTGGLGNIAGATGKLGNGAIFNGTGNGIPSDISGNSLIGMINFVRPTSSISINSWINWNSSGGNYDVIVGGDDVNMGNNERSFYLMVQSSTGSLHGCIVNSTNAAICVISNGNFSVNNMRMATMTYNGSRINIYINGVLNASIETSGNIRAGTGIAIGSFSDEKHEGTHEMFNGVIDEVGIWNRSLSASEITELYNSGNGLSYGAGAAPDILVTLTSPTNNSVSSTSSNLFNVSLSMSGTNYSHSWKNNTYNIWFSNGTLFNSTFVNSLATNSTNVSRTISGFVIGTYLWNSYACYGNTPTSNCTWATNNNTFTMGSSVNSITYNNNTYETSLEQFIINFSLAEGAELSLAKLNYNGTNYTISNITQVGNNYILERKINIPLNVNALANQTNTFYVSFTYSGGSVQSSSNYTQNSSFINLVKCGGSYNTQSLNFTFYDEYSLTNINSATNKTTLFSSFKYWLGDGSIYKNYSFQNLSSTLGNYQFCISPYANNITFKADMDMGFNADTYREGTYYLRNSTLTNISSDILLYLIPEDYATKFFLTFQNGNDLVSSGTINVQEYFIGLGQYKTVTILLTDMDGKATMWQEVDKSYRYSIVQDNTLLGIVDRVSICSATPCLLNILITQPIGSAFEAYNEYYAQNILSSITYNKTTGNVTYTFIDTTGLANYFRFEVKQSKVDETGTTICNLFSYSSAGTLTCDLTNQTGDFIATGYISRSPEKVDRLLNFVIDVDLLANLGTTGVFLVMILIITIVIGGVVISRGNPTTVLFLLGMALLGTKLIGILFFSWTIIVVLEVLIIWMIFQIKS